MSCTEDKYIEFLEKTPEKEKWKEIIEEAQKYKANIVFRAALLETILLVFDKAVLSNEKENLDLWNGAIQLSRNLEKAHDMFIKFLTKISEETKEEWIQLFHEVQMGKAVQICTTREIEANKLSSLASVTFNKAVLSNEREDPELQNKIIKSFRALEEAHNRFIDSLQEALSEDPEEENVKWNEIIKNVKNNREYFVINPFLLVAKKIELDTININNKTDWFQVLINAKAEIKWSKILKRPILTKTYKKAKNVENAWRKLAEIGEAMKNTDSAEGKDFLNTLIYEAKYRSACWAVEPLKNEAECIINSINKVKNGELKINRVNWNNMINIAKTYENAMKEIVKVSRNTRENYSDDLLEKRIKEDEERCVIWSDFNKFIENCINLQHGEKEYVTEKNKREKIIGEKSDDEFKTHIYGYSSDIKKIRNISSYICFISIVSKYVPAHIFNEANIVVSPIINNITDASIVSSFSTAALSHFITRKLNQKIDLLEYKKSLLQIDDEETKKRLDDIAKIISEKRKNHELLLKSLREKKHSISVLQRVNNEFNNFN